MRVVVATDADRERFNGFVASSDLADALQSYEWGEVKRAGGWSPVRLLVEDRDRIVAACSLLITRPARGLPPIAYAPRGPVLDYGDPGVLEDTVAAVREAAGRAFAFVCDPAIPAGSADARALGSAGLQRVAGSGFGGVQPAAVMLLDLREDLDRIHAGFKPKWRYNIGLAERRGVQVRRASAADAAVFHALLVETARRDGFLVRGPGYFDLLWEHLAPAGMLTAFIAEHDGEPLATVMLFCMGARVVYTYGASADRRRNLMPNHLIQWHAIRWAKEAGYHTYDFRGVSPVRDGQPTEPHLAGLNRFKAGFGARYLEYAGQYDLPLRRGWYLLWRTLAPRAISIVKTVRRRASG